MPGVAEYLTVHATAMKSVPDIMLEVRLETRHSVSKGCHRDFVSHGSIELKCTY